MPKDLHGHARNTAYAEALRSATREINPPAALLQREESDCFAVYDYALDVLSGEAAPIPEVTWPVLIDNAPPADLVSVGYAAEVSYHQSDFALQTFRMAADSRHADQAPKAARNLGLLLKTRGMRTERGRRTSSRSKKLGELL
jgi:hypothetical protein